MSWITMLYGAMAVVASTLAGIYLAAWVAQRDDGAHLMFVLLAVSMCGVAVTEFWMLQAQTLEEYVLATRLWHVPLWSGVCALVGLVHWRLRPRFSWVGWLAVALRTLALVANFLSESSLHYVVPTGIDHIRLFGEPLSMATGAPNPWMLLGQVSNLLLLIFVLDGGVCAWRRGERQRALSLALGLLIPVALGAIQSVLVYWGFVQMPVMIAPLLLFMAVAMGYELSDGLLRAARAEREVRSMDASLSELSASLAHELNQPLAVILTNAEAAQSLLRRTQPDLTEVSAILADIVDADRRAADLIRRIRALHDRGEPEREPLSVNDAIKRVLGLIGSELDEQGVTISLSLAADLPSVQADGILIDQVLLNLLTNAAEAVADNSPHDRRLSVTTFSHSNGVSIEIADNGCGAADPRRIFNAFHSTKPGRLGMGLAIVRSVVKSHGGRVWAESATGRGTTIYLSLPRDFPSS